MLQCESLWEQQVVPPRGIACGYSTLKPRSHEVSTTAGSGWVQRCAISSGRPTRLLPRGATDLMTPKSHLLHNLYRALVLT